jgi:hypothetical protein
MTDRDRRATLKITVLVFLVVVLAGAGWRSATIIYDNTAPVITDYTSGDIGYGTGKLTVRCFVDEAIEMDGVTCTIRPTGNWAPPTLIETLELAMDEKLDEDTYRYKGTFTDKIQRFKPYKLTYTALDKAGNKDTQDATIQAVDLDGYVTVNGQKITSQNDDVYVKTSLLTIKVHITSGKVDDVQGINMMINGQQYSKGDFTKKGNLLSGFHWETEYLLPGEGKYSFSVYIQGPDGQDIGVASFTVDYTGSKTFLLLGAVVVLGLILLVTLGKGSESGWRNR